MYACVYVSAVTGRPVTAGLTGSGAYNLQHSHSTWSSSTLVPLSLILRDDIRLDNRGGLAIKQLLNHHKTGR